MFRTSDVILIAVMLSAAAFTYKTKHDAEAMMRRVGSIEAQIQLERDRIDVLKADWSLLTQPARLERLAKAYEEDLGLVMIEPDQIAPPSDIADIPFRPTTVESLIAENVRQPASGARDPLVTGGVEP